MDPLFVSLWASCSLVLTLGDCLVLCALFPLLCSPYFRFSYSLYCLVGVFVSVSYLTTSYGWDYWEGQGSFLEWTFSVCFLVVLTFFWLETWVVMIVFFMLYESSVLDFNSLKLESSSCPLIFCSSISISVNFLVILAFFYLET